MISNRQRRRVDERNLAIKAALELFLKSISDDEGETLRTDTDDDGLIETIHREGYTIQVVETTLHRTKFNGGAYVNFRFASKRLTKDDVYHRRPDDPNVTFWSYSYPGHKRNGFYVFDIGFLVDKKLWHKDHV